MARAEARTAAQAVTTEGGAVNLLDQIVDQGRFGTESRDRDRGKEIVKRFVDEILHGKLRITADTEAMLNARIAEIDRQISAQLSEIMHHPDFQRLEASWRGLKYLISNSETGTMLKIKVLNASKKELLTDLEKATDFDQSALFKKVYEEEFGVFGGAPFGAILGDYEFGRSGQDITLLEKIGQVAAASHAPFLTAASSEMFNLESFTELDQPRDLGKIFDNTLYARWKAFRESEDSRYVALTVPRMLLREPYGRETVPVEEFDYEEDVTGKDHRRYLWGNAAWALGVRVTSAFSKYGWCATIRGVQSGGLVEGLPAHTFRTDAGDVTMKCPTEVPISDRREKELADLGFVPLVHCKDTPKAAFFSVQSAQKPKTYDSDSATSNARISAQLPYIFAVSRFAHYLKAMMRDYLGSYTSRSEIESYLNSWIANYVVANDDASFDVKARHPLRDARIDVKEIPGKPGAYRAVAFLRPHFQLDELNVSLRLVADLPQKAA